MPRLLRKGSALCGLLVFGVVGSAGAGVDVQINFSAPAPIEFQAPPETVVLPNTDVYVVPDVNQDIYFCDGWWWRPWHGHWYRSHQYSAGWEHVGYVPAFYRQVPSGWRQAYQERRWQGHAWNYQRVPSHQVQQNWSRWKRDKYWEKQHAWGVQADRHVRDAGPRPMPQQRQASMHRPPMQPHPQRIQPHPQPHGQPQPHKQNSQEGHGKPGDNGKHEGEIKDVGPNR